MSQTGEVTVFNYWMLETSSETLSMSSSKATRAAIVAEQLGHIIESTGEDVLVDLLDKDGHCRRIPTGWGDLDRLA